MPQLNFDEAAIGEWLESCSRERSVVNLRADDAPTGRNGIKQGRRTLSRRQWTKSALSERMPRLGA